LIHDSGQCSSASIPTPYGGLASIDFQLLKKFSDFQLCLPEEIKIHRRKGDVAGHLRLMAQTRD
jgi:hypothetical protein